MVRNDWVWGWVRSVANGVARAVANGSRRLGLGFGLRPSRMGCRGRREWFATIGFGFWAQTVANGLRRLGLSLGRTVANGVAGPSRMVLPDRRNWLSVTVRLDGDWVWQ